MSGMVVTFGRWGYTAHRSFGEGGLKKNSESKNACESKRIHSFALPLFFS